MLDTNVFFQSIHLRMAKLIKLYNLLRIRFACKNPSIYGMHPPTHTTHTVHVYYTHTRHNYKYSSISPENVDLKISYFGIHIIYKRSSEDTFSNWDIFRVQTSNIIHLIFHIYKFTVFLCRRCFPPPSVLFV